MIKIETLAEDIYFPSVILISCLMITNDHWYDGNDIRRVGPWWPSSLFTNICWCRYSMWTTINLWSTGILPSDRWSPRQQKWKSQIRVKESRHGKSIQSKRASWTTLANNRSIKPANVRSISSTVTESSGCVVMFIIKWRKAVVTAAICFAHKRKMLSICLSASIPCQHSSEESIGTNHRSRHWRWVCDGSLTCHFCFASMSIREMIESGSRCLVFRRF